MGWWFTKDNDKYTGDIPNYDLNINVKCSIDNNFGLFDNVADDPMTYIISDFKADSSWYLIQDNQLNVSTK